MLGIQRSDNLKKLVLKKRTKTVDVIKHAHKMKWTWADHILRKKHSIRA